MTIQEWVAKARQDKVKLRQFVESYHPYSSKKSGRTMKITAPAPEVARQRIDPVIRFDKALECGNFIELMSVLNGAWFGVPESTQCWGIDGFKETVDLMDATKV